MMKKLFSLLSLILSFSIASAQNCDVNIQVDQSPMGIILTANATGAGTYTFSWSNGQTGASIVANSFLNTYCVDLITSDSCFASACVTLGGANCSVEIEASPNTPILSANATGTAPFTYQWSDGTVGQTTQISPNVTNYCVTVTDADGCSAEDCYSTNPSSCNVEIVLTPSGALFASGNGFGNISYLWNNGEMTSSILPTSNGEYCVTTTDTNGCTAEDCFDYQNSNGNCSVEIGVDTIAQGGAINYLLTANGTGTAPFSYLWENGEISQSIEVSGSGIYCVVLEDADSCVTTACVEIGGNTNCSVNIFQTFLGGLTANVGMNAVTFLWSTNETTQTINPATTGEYCVTATDTNGCVATDCYFFDNGGGQDSCYVVISQIQGGTWLNATASGTAPYTFVWNTGDSNSSIPINPNMNTYCVTVTDAENCVATACATIGGNNCNVFIQETALGNLGAYSNNMGNFSYLWNTGETTQTITPDVSAEYCVTLTDGNGCEASDCYFWVMDSLCTTSVFPIQIPGTNTWELSTINSGVAPYSYQWSTGELTETIVISTTGTYCATVTDANGCQAGACVTVVVQTPQFTVSGYVHPSDTLMQNVLLDGLAYLYLLDANGTPALIDSVALGATPLTGNFYDFGAVAQGDYIVKVALNLGSPLYEVSLPTYHWSEEFWQDASTINVPYFGQQFFDIYMIYGDNEDGDGLIDGGVFVFDGLGTPTNNPNSLETKNLGPPISNISILLFDEFEEPAGHTVTNAEGKFKFDNLAWGTYKVWVEITGKEQAFYWVTIGPDEPHVSGIFFAVDDEEVTTNLQEIIAGEGIKIFPNPTSDIVNISLNIQQSANLQLSITSLIGQTLQTDYQLVTKGTQIISLDVSNIPSGLYFINISDGQEVISHRLVID